jgi:hypothetical protein
MSLYRLLRDDPSYDAKKGDELDLDLSETEEKDMLDARRFEIVPRIYKVIGGSVVHDTEPDGTFEAALLVGQEAHLIAAGHIERVARPAKESKKGAKT